MKCNDFVISCTSNLGDKRTMPIIVTVTPILIASILITLCLVIVLCSVISKNRRRKETRYSVFHASVALLFRSIVMCRPDFMESKVFDEVCNSKMIAIQDA